MCWCTPAMRTPCCGTDVCHEAARNAGPGRGLKPGEACPFCATKKQTLADARRPAKNRRQEFIQQEAGKQWDAAERRTPTREEDRWGTSLGSKCPPRIEDVARKAVAIATALADALGLKEDQ